MGDKKYDYICEHMGRLLNIGILYEDENGKLRSFQENPTRNPLYMSEELRNTLKGNVKENGKLYIYNDHHNVCFGCVPDEEKLYYFGPISLEIMDRTHLHYFFRDYGVDSLEEKQIKKYTVAEIVNLAQILAAMLTGKEYEESEMEYNKDAKEQKKQFETEEICLQIEEEEEELCHHTYMEECQLLDCVRKGRVEEAVMKSQNMDSQLGKMSSKESQQWKNACIVAITLCTRAAIEGGVSPHIAYRISDFYIQKCDQSKNALQSMKYRDQAVERITEEVYDRREKKHMSSYVGQCKDYVRKHYKEKIYLEDIANTIGVSRTYLSHLFKSETGICLQDYITKFRVEKAADLLKYSNEQLPRIAERVNFPSQSYFGKVFKKYKKVTPLKYRELYKPRES